MSGAEKDENLFVLIMKTLRLLSLCDKGFHQENLAISLQFLIKNYAIAKKNELLLTIKAHITQHLSLLFQRMKEKEANLASFSANSLKFALKMPSFLIFSSFDTFFRPTARRASSQLLEKPALFLNNSGLDAFKSQRPVKKREISMDFSLLNPANLLNNSNSNVFSPGHFFNDCNKAETTGFDLLFTQKNSLKIAKLPSYLYEDLFENQENQALFQEIVKQTVTFLVDATCLNASNGRFGENVEEIVPEIESFSRFSGSFLRKSAEIANEMGNSAGKFGWFYNFFEFFRFLLGFSAKRCVICRETADFYCRNSRKPICGVNCKRKLQETDEKLNNLLKVMNFQEKPLLVSDFLGIVKEMAQNAGKDLIS